MARSRAGDTAAFDALVTKYRGRVYATVYQIVRNQDDAWDIAQETFVKAWRSVGRFAGRSSFYTWLYRIALNLAIDFLRAREAARTTEFDETVGPGAAAAGAMTAPGVAPDRQVDAAAIRVRIEAALAALSPDHRAVVLLKEFEGLRYHEIAGVVGCSIGTVMSRLFYARRRLQDLLKDLYGEL